MKRNPFTLILIPIFLIGGFFMTTLKPSMLLTKPIVSISGIVGDLNNSILEYTNTEKPTHDHSSIYYKRFYISKFTLNKMVIVSKFTNPMKINNGDNVIVAGYTSGNQFQVLAYSNQSNNTGDNENWMALIFAALLFFGIAFKLATSSIVQEGTIIPRLFIAAFMILSAYMVFRALLIKEAIDLLQKMNAQ